MFRGEIAEYKVEEPETPIPEHGFVRGFEIPRGGDEELLELLDSWMGRSPETIALQYNDRGDDLLESFLERHVADIPDGGQRLKMWRHALEDFGTKFAEDRTFGAQNKMELLLKTQVMPLVKSVMRADARKKEARGQRDFVPGRASEARDQRALVAKQNVASAILSDITGMKEFNLVQELQSDSSLRRLSPDEELMMNQANLTLIGRQLEMWNQANQEHEGAFNSQLTRLQREFKATQTKINFTMQEIHGMGARARQRRGRGVDRSLGRPQFLLADASRQDLLDQGSRNALAGALSAPSRSPSQLRLRGGVGSKSRSGSE